MKNLHKICLLFAFMAVLSLIWVSQYVFATDNFLFDDFNSYSAGPLNGQGGWTANYDYWVVLASPDFEGAFGFGCIDDTFCGGERYVYHDATPDANGVEGIYMRTDSYATASVNFSIMNATTYVGQIYTKDANGHLWGLTSGLTFIDLGSYNLNTWYFIQMEWRSSDKNVRYRIDNNEWSAWYAPFQNWTTADRVFIQVGGSTAYNVYYDYLSSTAFTSGGFDNPHITVSSPASASTITATSDTMAINYYDIDPSIYKGILMNFRDDKLHISTDSYDYQLATGDSGTGSFTVPISSFNFTENGHFDFHALAYGNALSIESGMFLTTRGYVDVFSDELVIPLYDLTFNVSGLATPFTFDNWDTWYGTNVSDYASPSDFATTIAGYLQPYFERVGGFGSQASLYFNEAEAYDRGFGLGQIFPAVADYIKKIEMFFGGFPLLTFFKYILYTLTAIFAVRTILKFIPGLG
jgi:hypothetical protein